MELVRRIGLSAIGLAAVAVWFLLAPSGGALGLTEEQFVRDYGNLVAQALDDAEGNEALADSAPQQQVVNGWVARDLLSIVALQNEDLLDAVAVNDDRIPALLVLAVLAICLNGLTSATFRFPSFDDGGGLSIGP